MIWLTERKNPIYDFIKEMTIQKTLSKSTDVLLVWLVCIDFEYPAKYQEFLPDLPCVTVNMSEMTNVHTNSAVTGWLQMFVNNTNVQNKMEKIIALFLRSSM